MYNLLQVIHLKYIPTIIHDNEYINTASQNLVLISKFANSKTENNDNNITI